MAMIPYLRADRADRISNGGQGACASADNVLSYTFRANRCPVCAASALRGDAGQQRIAIECGHCGSFDITSAAKQRMAAQSRTQRDAWLSHARAQAQGTGRAILVQRANNPGHH